MTSGPRLSAAAGAGEQGDGLAAFLGRLGQDALQAAAQASQGEQLEGR
jgi:hypothetical protein